MADATLDLDTIFCGAIEIASPEERAAHIARACGPDLGLRERINKLVAAHFRAGSFLEIPAPTPSTAGELQSSALEASAALRELPGTLIGPYKLLQKLGEGGMGTVFMAEQTRPVQRRVALKLIKAGMDSAQILARFEAERQALAMMDHVNIARVLDAGAAESGRPYFVMELVHGVPITKYCDDNHLTPRERLELFVPVCQAIQHAHQKGIIHRDIKPSNVMITLYDGKPVPKVIDFGVAKATEQRLTERTLFTQYGTMVGTLEYMSPEQAEMSALGADTRSDIFSLGVLLYELLTGNTPLSHKRVREAAYAEVLRMIKEEEAPKPSTRLSDSGEALASISAQRHMEPAKLTKLVKGELDWIVMKTLEKDRSRRYETASAFAADVQRYLNDEPVHACPPSAWYRFRKFARRNKGPVLAASLVVLVLVGGIIGTTWGMLRATVAEAEAVNETNQKEQALGEKNEALTTSEANYGEAKKQEKLAKDNEKTAQAQELLARRRLYAAQINLAHQAWETGQMARVLELLESQRPRPDEEDLRSFEWYYLWRLCNRNWRATLRGKAPLALSPDGQTLASASPDSSMEPYYTNSGVLTLWDLATGAEKSAIKLKTQVQLTSMAFTPDGKTLVAASWGGTLHLCDVATAQERAIIRASGKPVRSLALSPDGKIIAAGSVKPSGEGVGLWDTTTGKELAFLPGHKEIICLAYSPDGKTVASLAGWGEDAGVKFWDLASKKLRLTVMTGWEANIAFAPDGKTLATGHVFVDVESGKQRPSHQGHVGRVYGLAYSADGKMLVSGADDRVVKLSDLATGQTRKLGVHSDEVFAVAVSPDGKTVASGSFDGTVKLWDTTPANEDVAFKSPSGFHCLGFTPDSKGLLVATGGPTKLLDASTGKEKASPPGGSVVAISPDANLLASEVAKDKLVIWDVAAARQRAVLPVSVSSFSLSGSSFHGAVFSPDGKTLAMWKFWERDDETIRLWDIGTQRLRTTIAGSGAGSTIAAAFSPDGKLLAAAGHFNSIKLWDLSTGAEKFSVRVGRGDDPTRSVAFSPDSRLVAAGSAHGAVRIWDTGTMHLRASLKGHTDLVFALAFSRDAKTVASGGRAGSIKLWDVATGQERLTLKGHNATVWRLAFSPRGHTLASGSEDGTVRLWQAASDPEATARKIELDPDDPANPVALNDAGDRLWAAGRASEAEQAYRLALSRLEGLNARFPETLDYWRELAHTGFNLGLVLASTNRTQEAEQARQQVLKLLTEVSADPRQELARQILRTQLLRRYIDLAWHLIDGVHLPQEGEKASRQGLAVAEKLIAEFPDVAEHRRQLADLHFALGWSLVHQKRFAEAANVFRQELELREKSGAGLTNQPEDRFQLSKTYNALGIALFIGGRGEETIGAFRQALAVSEKLALDLPNEPRYLDRVALDLNNLGNALRDAGRPQEAEHHYRKAIDLFEHHPDQKDPSNRRDQSVFGLALILSQGGRNAEAAQVYSWLLELKPDNAPACNNLAWFLATCPDPKFRDPAKAVKLAQKALDMAPKEGNHWNTLGVAHYRVGDWKAATEALEKSKELLGDTELSFNAFFLAMAHWKLDQKQEAHKWHDQAVAWMEKNKPQDEELKRFRAEAEDVLKIEKKPTPR
jgi:eukaryotic-like serine/threonine-protein kinase